MKVARVNEMREMDRYAIDTLRIPEELLMENAGLAAIRVLEAERGISGCRHLLLCGQGNNGGDGFVCARQILSRGGDVHVLVLGDEHHFHGAAAINLAILHGLTPAIAPVTSADEVKHSLQEADVVIDALFGTGLNREITGLPYEVIHQVNASGKPVLSLDIPSGVNGDTGAVMGIAVRATYTVTFGLPKVGNLLLPGFSYGGKLFHSYISFPPTLYHRPELKVAINIPVPLPARDVDAHKGQMGDCLFIAGARNYFGAPFLSAMSFLTAGGGYARLAAPRSIIGTIATLGPEIVFLPQTETASGTLALTNKEHLWEVAQACDMVVMGPGLALEPETKELVRQLVRVIDKPVIIDGDGLTAVAEDLTCLKERTAITCLTPHPGEMARLTGRSITEIKRNRVAVLEETAQALHAIVVLKGAHTVIGCPDGRVVINLTGNAGMATAGAGDVLTGTIAAMAGIGLDWEEAVKKGVFIHGWAGDLAACARGEEGVTARTIMDYLPQAIMKDREGGSSSIIVKKITCDV